MHQNIPIEKKIGQLLIVGFHGTSVDCPGVQQVLMQAERGEIGGIAIYRYNIADKIQLEELLKAFREVKSEYPLFISLDQEGGKVQRINSANGHADTFSAKKVAETMTVEEARAHYEELGEMLQTAGFNFNCAPCVDLDGSPGCEVIGGIERAYSSDVDTVVSYASSMMAGLHEYDVLNCIKHFPGHGRVKGDTHEGLVDISETWTEEELEPFRLLIEQGNVDAVMSAHLLGDQVDAEHPCTLSAAWLGKLREDFGFEGVIVSDCMHMGAMLNNYTLKQVVELGVNAGLDIFYFSNNPLAAQASGVRHSSDAEGDFIAVNEWRVPDIHLPAKIRDAMLEGLNTGTISEEAINSSYERVMTLKDKIK